MRDQAGKSRGYAFIEYHETRHAEIAYKRAHGKRIDDFNILVDMESARTDRYWLPRRLGGGKGGDSRKATKEHDAYLKEIKRELRAASETSKS